MTRLWKVRAKISEFMDLAPLDDREIPQNVDERLADTFASVHYTENRLIDAQTPLEKVLQHRGAHARVFRRTQPYAQGHLRPIYCDTESYDDGLSGHLKAIHHQCRKLKRLQPPRQVFLELLRRLAHEVTAGGTLARATRLQLGRGFVQTRFVISGRYPHQDLIQHSLWKRVFFAEGFEVWKRRLLARLRTNSRSRHLDSTTTEAQLSVRAPPVVMSSPLLVLALGPGDLLGVLFQE